jgi:hypothetical protein
MKKNMHYDNHCPKCGLNHSTIKLVRACYVNCKYGGVDTFWSDFWRRLGQEIRWWVKSVFRPLDAPPVFFNE